MGSPSPVPWARFRLLNIKAKIAMSVKPPTLLNTPPTIAPKFKGLEAAGRVVVRGSGTPPELVDKVVEVWLESALLISVVLRVEGEFDEEGGGENEVGSAKVSVLNFTPIVEEDIEGDVT
jgi:hypothetical protein